MGANKMLLHLEGESLVRRAARRAPGAGLSPVAVVLGHEADRVRAELQGLKVEFAVNPDFTGPTSGSLHQGLNKLGPDVDAVVVMLGDMVRVSPETLAMLVAAARGTEAPLVVSRYGDVTAPPLLFRRALFGELLAWSGEGCGKTVVDRRPGRGGASRDSAVGRRCRRRCAVRRGCPRRCLAGPRIRRRGGGDDRA